MFLTQAPPSDRREETDRFRATLPTQLQDNVWTVSGTLHGPDGKGGVATPGDGGVAVVQISKVDAHVVSMTHQMGICPRQPTQVREEENLLSLIRAVQWFSLCSTRAPRGLRLLSFLID